MCADLAARLTGEPTPSWCSRSWSGSRCSSCPSTTGANGSGSTISSGISSGSGSGPRTPGRDRTPLWPRRPGTSSGVRSISAVEYLVRARELGRGARPDHGPRARRSSSGARWPRSSDGSPACPETVRAGRRDVSLLLAFLKGAEGQAAGSEDILGPLVADPAATTGERACARRCWPRWPSSAPKPEITVGHGPHAPSNCSDGLGRRPDPDDHGPERRTVARDHVLGSAGGRAHFLAGRHGAGTGVDANGGSIRPGRPTRAGGSASSARWPWSRRGAAGWIGPRRWPTRPWEWPARSASSPIRSRPMPTWPPAWWPWNAASPGGRRWRCARGGCGPRPIGASRWCGSVACSRPGCRRPKADPDEATATIGAARRELGAPPPPVVEGGLVALRSRLLRLGGAPEQAWHLLRDEVDSPALLVETAAAALASGRIDHARKAPRRHAVDRVRTATDGGAARAGGLAGVGRGVPRGRLALPPPGHGDGVGPRPGRGLRPGRTGGGAAGGRTRRVAPDFRNAVLGPSPRASSPRWPAATWPTR